MARFFSADFHLNSTAILQYAKRPFKTGEKMAEAYIRSCNQQARDPSDMIVHVGDFFLKGADRHGVGDEGLGVSAKEYLSKINAQVFLIEGNHDSNNVGHTHAKQLILDLGPYKNTSVSHYPSTDKGTWTLRGKDKEHLHIHLCGHVHEKWKWKLDLEKLVLNINVGVDQWKHQIVSEKKLIGYIMKLMASQEFKDTLYPEAAKPASSMIPNSPSGWDDGDPAEEIWRPRSSGEKW